jgi:serine/threonine-protein kinase
VLHRDVKPANVLAGPEGFRVTDFGLASLDDDQTTETDLMGTLVYVAPERLEGARGSTRSDVFSAAVVLYEAASGVQPFRADDPSESIARLRAGDAPPLPGHLPLTLRTALHRALCADPEDRPADARALLEAVRGGLPPEPTVVLDATAVLPAAGPEDPTEDVFGRGRPAAPVSAEPVREEPVRVEPVERTGASVFATPPVLAPEARSAPSEPTVAVPGASERTVAVPPPAAEPPRAPRPSAGDRFSHLLAVARRRPELAIAVIGAALVVLLVLAELLTSDGGTDADPATGVPVEQPASLDGVLDRIEEIGR